MPEIAIDVLLAPYTTFQIGGKAEYFAIAKSIPELQELVAWADAKQIPILVLGSGSNVLINDTGLSRLVIKLEQSGITYEKMDETTLVTVAAGVVFDDLVQETISRELWGLENLSHIPGTVGATPIQNVGAYGVDVSSLITLVTVLDIEKNSLQTFSNERCQFGYRHSIFKTDLGKKYIVVSVTFSLSSVKQPRLEYKDLRNYFVENSSPTLRELREAVIAIRSQKFPDWKAVGTAGSFFKNPIIRRDHFDTLLAAYPELPGYVLSDSEVKVPLGWILDKVCNLKGYRLGQVGTYEGQSLVIVNYGGATFNDVKNFADYISEKVFEATQIKIEWEVTAI